ncbi:MAG: hypothetical protein Greene041619_133 [Candidatus Peregrinibacteria bacterium Greene0416_19]|nr:MAG: hypothetical protein Greene041619_133 [Candidatus Peregrinibacteria bacterium Greene0416_19]
MDPVYRRIAWILLISSSAVGGIIMYELVFHPEDRGLAPFGWMTLATQAISLFFFFGAPRIERWLKEREGRADHERRLQD